MTGSNSGGSIKEFFKIGFGVGAGVFVAQALFFLLGIALFIPGIMLMKRGSSQDKKVVSEPDYYGGLVLMILGVVLMGGIGFGYIIENLDF